MLPGRIACGRVDLLAVHGQERLVRGYDMLFVPQSIKDEFLGGLVSPDQFDHDIDIRIIDQFFCIARELHVAQGDAPVALEIEIRYLFQDNRGAEPSLDDPRVLDQNARRARAYRAEADNAHVD